ncbi:MULTISPECIES: phage tail protein [Actinokineospora]|uniref:Phage tail protein n=1 Tax=Actinokineospora fastidiosa TaxID=1816 RepID=A0A918LET1_9PSEU|nr:MULTISPECIES: phage tail protein [Actinokineospora]UVS80843.1 T4-like virus tail tube protein gp19 [Actinokineospora sp. UTMC 2448]GGS37610.1 phage tail protein [Actinokineospora fastidiosa]
MAGGLGSNQPNDALTAARFSITIDGYEIASFSELQGITTEVEPVELMESTDKEVVLKKLPGKTKPATLVLKRGKNSSMELWAWHEAVLAGDIVAARKSCSLVMYGTDGKPVARYHLEHAWPSKLEIGALKAGSSEVLMETVTIVSERIQRVSV